jgi:hypothetical protein
VRKKRNTLRDTELKEEEHRELAGEEKKERLREFLEECSDLARKISEILNKKLAVEAKWSRLTSTEPSRVRVSNLASCNTPRYEPTNTDVSTVATRFISA